MALICPGFLPCRTLFLRKDAQVIKNRRNSRRETFGKANGGNSGVSRTPSRFIIRSNPPLRQPVKTDGTTITKNNRRKRRCRPQYAEHTVYLPIDRRRNSSLRQPSWLREADSNRRSRDYETRMLTTTPSHNKIAVLHSHGLLKPRLKVVCSN